jgi:hypothetical protein
MNRDQSIRAEPSKKQDVMQNEAIKAHLLAAKDAAVSSSMGNPDIARIRLHLMEAHELTPGVPHALRPFKAEIKAVTAAVAALKKSHPDLASQLEQADGLLKEFKNLSS